MTTRKVAELEELRFAWTANAAFRLDIAAFSVEQGERILLTGHSGSGKSTLITLLTGAVLATSGRVQVLGQDLGQLSAGTRDRFRADHIGVIFQTLNLIPYLSIIDNVLLPLSFSPLRASRLPGAQRQAEAARLLERLGIDPGSHAGLSTSQLSVGQQQRVAAARALIGGPDLVIADEPTSALDRASRDAFLELVLSETKRAGSAFLMASHEAGLEALFDRTIRMEDLLIARSPA